MKNILLTGKPGCGKTTVIKEILKKLKGIKAAGFFTEEIREKGGRKGFKITSLDGEEAIMAHVDIKSSYKVSKYKVDVDAVEDVGANALIKGKKNADIIVIDEIGKMELFSELFKLSVLEVLASEKKILGTITKAKDKFVEDIKARDDVKIIEVARENRDALPEEIVKLLTIV